MSCSKLLMNSFIKYEGKHAILSLVYKNQVKFPKTKTRTYLFSTKIKCLEVLQDIQQNGYCFRCSNIKNCTNKK